MHRCPARAQGTLLLVVLSLLGACQTTSGDADMRLAVDMRRSNGNPNIGQVCDDTRKCAMGVRCAVAVDADQVGFCAPTCMTDDDCDTALGKAYCFAMGAGGMQCVLSCTRQDAGSSAIRCPSGWTCVPAGGTDICRPPQTPPAVDMK